MRLSDRDVFIVARARRSARLWSIVRYPLVPVAFLLVGYGISVLFSDGYSKEALAQYLGTILSGIGVGLVVLLVSGWRNKERELLLRLAVQKDRGGHEGIESGEVR